MRRLFALLLLTVLTLGSVSAHAGELWASQAASCHETDGGAGQAPDKPATVAASACVGCTLLPDASAAVKAVTLAPQRRSLPAAVSGPPSRDPSPEPRPPRLVA
jgi:hypothetical protein